MSKGMPSNATELFDKLAPLGLVAYPEKIREIQAAFVFKIEGEGEWLLNCNATPPSIGHSEQITVSEAVGSTPLVTIEVSSDDFKTLMFNYNAGIDLYFANKLRVIGDPAVAIKLGLLFEIIRPFPG